MQGSADFGEESYEALMKGGEHHGPPTAEQPKNNAVAAVPIRTAYRYVPANKWAEAQKPVFHRYKTVVSCGRTRSTTAFL